MASCKNMPMAGKAPKMLGETSGHTNAEGNRAVSHFANMKRLGK